MAMGVLFLLVSPWLKALSHGVNEPPGQGLGGTNLERLPDSRTKTGIIGA